jgi:hypothetical protein
MSDFGRYYRVVFTGLISRIVSRSGVKGRRSTGAERNINPAQRGEREFAAD